MAHIFKNLKLPQLAVACRSTETGEQVNKKFKRAMPDFSSPKEPARVDTRDDTVESVAEVTSSETVSLPSLYSIEERAKVASWKYIRKEIIDTMVENEAMPLSQLCIICSIKDAVCRCIQCGPIAYYCIDCLRNSHSCVNFLHTPEKLEVCIHYSFIMLTFIIL